MNRIDIDESQIDKGMVFVVVKGTEKNGFNVAVGLEFGTGIYGEKKRFIEAKHLTPRGRKGFMKFKDPGGEQKHSGPIPGNISFKSEGYIFTQKTRGIEPKLFMTRAVESIMQQQDSIFQEVLDFYGVTEA